MHMQIYNQQGTKEANLSLRQCPNYSLYQQGLTIKHVATSHYDSNHFVVSRGFNENERHDLEGTIRPSTPITGSSEH